MQEPRSGKASDGLLGVSVAAQNGVVTLEAEGELDLSTAGGLHESLLKAIAEGGHLLVDLTRVSFIDSSGIAALVGAFRSRNGDGRMCVLIEPGSQVARVFELARIGEALPVFTDRAEAVSRLSTRGAR